MQGGIHPTLWLAFIAGLLSFVSPCCLPLYPSYISGMTFNEKQVLGQLLYRYWTNGGSLGGSNGLMLLSSLGQS